MRECHVRVQTMGKMGIMLQPTGLHFLLLVEKEKKLEKYSIKQKRT